jgi:hypothetical protein
VLAAASAAVQQQHLVACIVDTLCVHEHMVLLLSGSMLHSYGLYAGHAMLM